jgi:hypothetical protein
MHVLGEGLFAGTLLPLPVLPQNSVSEGDSWDLSAPPYVSPDTFNTILKGDLDSRKLPKTRIVSKWTKTEDREGYRCALIESSFTAKTSPTPERNESSEVSYSVKSWFGIDLGLPVVNLIEANGRATDVRGVRTDVRLRKKEILVSATQAAQPKEARP